MKPAFSTVWSNYPHRRDWSQGILFSEMGWQEFLGNANYENTCAIRVSYALQKSGIDIQSSAGMRALDGPVKGKIIEINQKRLSEYLETLWGSPEKYTAAEAYDAIGERNGIISFWELSGYDVGGRLGGHIDVIDGLPKVQRHILWLYYYTTNEDSVCGSSCYFNKASRVWFWELR